MIIDVALGIVAGYLLLMLAYVVVLVIARFWWILVIVAMGIGLYAWALARN